uniref:DUF4283 domain-containing protein n=1 Tax=Cannabis sativa TaxID=3483 RepID=A0A803PE82_CANSA
MCEDQSNRVETVNEGIIEEEENIQKGADELELLRQDFFQSMTLDLEPDFELSEEITRTGILARFFDGKGVSRSRLKEILSHIWKPKLRGAWKFKTLKTGLWGIFFDLEEDCVEILTHRPWLINGKLLLIKEWPEDGAWASVNMNKTIFWAMASGLPTPYLNRSNIPTVGRKAGIFKRSDTADQRLITRRGFFKFQVEIDVLQPLSTGFYLDMRRGRKEWIQFRFFKLPRKESSVLPPTKERSTTKEKGKSPVTDRHYGGRQRTQIPKPVKKVIRINDRTAGATFGKNLKVVEKNPLCPAGACSSKAASVPQNSSELIRDRRARSISPSFWRRHGKGNSITLSNEEIVKKFSSRPYPDARDAQVIATIMSQNGPTYLQTIEGPHEEVCMSRQPHKYPEKTPFPWPSYAEEVGLAEELMGPVQVDKFEPVLTLFHDPKDVSDEIHPCPQPRKRKACPNLMPYVPRTEENTKEFSMEIPEMLPFSPNPSTSTFKIGAGAPATNSKTEKRRRKGSNSRASSSSSKGRREAIKKSEITRNLEESLDLVEVRIDEAENIHMGEEAALIKPPNARMKDVARELGFTGVVCYPVNGLSGGFCLMWNWGLIVDIVRMENGVFKAEVWDGQISTRWRLFTIYGTLYSWESGSFWEDMAHKINLCSLPWMVIGDLNCILSSEEKQGGRKVDVNDTKYLYEFLDYTGGIDLRYKGCAFTWHNKRFSGGLIRERLDRAIGSHDWLNMYQYAGVHNFPIIVSDHAPILLDTCMFVNKGFKPFRFFDAWTTDASCSEVVKTTWVNTDASPCTLLIRNLDQTRRALQKWRKNVIGDVDSVIQRLENRLCQIQLQQVSDALLAEEADLQKKNY